MVARLVPRSAPPAATLIGGLRPGSLRVHDPCKEVRHASRLGFPGRRQPRDPAAPGNVARGLHVLPRGGGSLETQAREEWLLEKDGIWFAASRRPRFVSVD